MDKEDSIVFKFKNQMIFFSSSLFCCRSAGQLWSEGDLDYIFSEPPSSWLAQTACRRLSARSEADRNCCCRWSDDKQLCYKDPLQLRPAGPLCYKLPLLFCFADFPPLNRKLFMYVRKWKKFEPQLEILNFGAHCYTVCAVGGIFKQKINNTNNKK